MQKGLGLSADQIHDTFKQWNEGRLQSFLIEITRDIFSHKAPGSDHLLVNDIKDEAKSKGTGKWTSQEGLDLPMPIPTIDSAVMMRNLSSLIEERREASELYKTKGQKIDADGLSFESLLYDALFFATIISYAQGLALLTRASEELKMDIPLPEVVSVWRGGCIIRSALLDRFKKAYENAGLRNLLLDEEIAELMMQKLGGLQKVVSKVSRWLSRAKL